MSTAPVDSIGLIGVGAMGGAMARRLLQARRRVIAFDCNHDQLGALRQAGAEAADDAAEVAHRGAVILTSLPTPEAFAEVAERHLLPQARADQVFIDVGTSQVSDTRRLAEAFARRGAALLDAPVSGGPGGAERGTLRIFVGGDEQTYRRMQPILHILGQPDGVLFCGPSGAGQIVKAVNQLAMGLTAAACLESLAFGVRLGFDPDLLRRAVGGDASWRQQFAEIAAKVAAGQGSDIGVKAGQLRLFLQSAAAQGMDMPMSEALDAFCRDGEHLVLEANRPSPSFWHELTHPRKR